MQLAALQGTPHLRSALCRLQIWSLPAGHLESLTLRMRLCVTAKASGWRKNSYSTE
jgi:hypothetical protein